MEEKYICFNLAEEQFAIPLLTVKEVIKIQEVTPVPQMPSHILGIFNLRGQVITVMDLRKKLGLSTQVSPETAIMILNFGKNVLGVVVDAVNAVHTLKDNELQEKPMTLAGAASSSVVSVFRKDEKLILVLDIAKALSVEELMQMGMAA